jgi:hypothetical protein
MKLGPVMSWFVRDRPRLKVVQTGITVERLGVCVREGNSLLCNEINVAQAALAADGTLAALMQWLGNSATLASWTSRIMIRCVRLWAGKDGNSHFEEGMIDLAPSARLARWGTSRYASTVAGQARGVGMRKYAEIFGAFSMSFASLLGASHAQEIAVTAIDILLEPDTTMVRHAQADNTRLLNAYPKGFALDATHHPHLTLVQQFVRTADLSKVYAAANQVLAKEKAGGWNLKAF